MNAINAISEHECHGLDVAKICGPFSLSPFPPLKSLKSSIKPGVFGLAISRDPHVRSACGGQVAVNGGNFGRFPSISKQQRRKLCQVSSPDSVAMLAGQFYPCISNALVLQPIAELLIGFQQFVIVAAAYPQQP